MTIALQLSMTLPDPAPAPALALRHAPALPPRVPPAERWQTAHDPMTRAQQAYLNVLALVAGVDAPRRLTKAQAATRIDELQQCTGWNG